MGRADAGAAEPRRLPETAAALAVRRAVRAWRAAYGRSKVAVALSGGADSLALTAAAVVEMDAVDALVIDHQLQPGSAAVAAAAAAAALSLGCRSARILPVVVGGTGGLEAAAREARYAALAAARTGLPVLLGHTLDDQAETVLLGLARGSGGRSIQGMTEWAEPWGRPLLAVRRETTRRLCAEIGLTPHDDPHNHAPEFTRVRLRTEVLPLLEDVLGGGAAPGGAPPPPPRGEVGPRDQFDSLSRARPPRPSPRPPPRSAPASPPRRTARRRPWTGRTR
uniref:tRNA lysidine(34) synthetase TilS n=1 Tax=Nocardia brasiliensis TaxID=37326 RepID=UPI002458F285